MRQVQKHRSGVDRMLVHIFHSTTRRLQTERAARYILTGWSAQRDKHGAFKLKPSEARFQLVDNNGEPITNGATPVWDYTSLGFDRQHRENNVCH